MQPRVALSGLVLVAAVVADCSAQTTVPASQPAHVPAKPETITGVSNFARVSPILFRGVQPTAEGFAELKSRGVRTIVSLRTFHSDRSLLKGTGLKYIRIDAKAWHPEEEDLLVFLKVLSDPANQPVFVHCQQGADRTGYMVAAYRVIEEGWTSQEACDELQNFDFHKIWTKVPEALKRLDPADIKAKVEKASPPEIETIE